MKPALGTLVVLLGYTTLVVFVAFGSPRFAEPIILLLVPFAVLAVRGRDEIVRRIGEWNGRSFAACGALGALAFFWLIVVMDKTGL